MAKVYPASIVVLLVVIGGLAWKLYVTHPQDPESSVVTPEAQSEEQKTTSVPVSVQESNTPLSKSVSLVFPKAGANVPASFEVTGSAPGAWFFEGSFPVQVRDESGKILASTVAHAQGEWMTEKLVQFTASVTTNGYHGIARVVLLKDNPSGLPENEDAVEIPITIQ